MTTRIALFVVTLLALGQPGVGQQTAPAGERLIYLRWEKWSPLHDEIAKRCLLVETNGHYRFERVTESMGGGGGEKGYEGQVSPEELAALKALITSADFNHMQIPKSKRTGNRETIHNEAEMIDYSSPEDELPPVSIDSIDGDVAIPKPLKQLGEWMKKIEKAKGQAIKGPMQMCGRTERQIMMNDEDHRIDTPPKK